MRQKSELPVPLHTIDTVKTEYAIKLQTSIYKPFGIDNLFGKVIS